MINAIIRVSCTGGFKSPQIGDHCGCRLVTVRSACSTTDIRVISEQPSTAHTLGEYTIYKTVTIYILSTPA